MDWLLLVCSLHCNLGESVAVTRVTKEQCLAVQGQMSSATVYCIDPQGNTSSTAPRVEEPDRE